MLAPVIVIVCGVIFWLIYRSYEFNQLDVLPGPGRLELFKILLKMKPHTMFSTIISLTEQYGDRYIFKIFSRRVLHLSRPEDIELVLTNSSNITKSMPYEFIQSWLGSGLLLNTGSSWLKRRKMMTPTFHFNILRNFAVVMQDKSRDLVSRLRAAPPADVDVLQVISDFTLFTICETVMGTRLDSDESSTTVDYKNAIQNIGNLMLDRLTKIWLHSDFIFKLTSGGRQFDKYLHTVFSFADKVIWENKKKGTEGDSERVKATLAGEDVGTKRKIAMLDLLLEGERKGEIDLTGIRDEVNTFMFAGHDTTAMAVTFCLMLLADYEDIQESVYEEITRVLGSNDRPPCVSDFAELKLLDAVIKETLRLYPSVPFIGREVTEDFMLGDILVKKDTEISVHIYETHHRADIYPDPEAFNPERFLAGEIKHPYAYIPFSAGPRNCIGQRFAMQEMKFVITELCRNFKLVPKVKGVRPILRSDMILRPAEPIYVKFVPRLL